MLHSRKFYIDQRIAFVINYPITKAVLDGQLIAIDIISEYIWQKISEKMNRYRIAVISVFERFFPAAEIIGAFSFGGKEIAAVPVTIPAPCSNQI